MPEPTFDRDGYPTGDTLRIIEEWEVKTWRDAIECMDFVGRAWHYPDYWQVERGWVDDLGSVNSRYMFSTGGWSGNESLVSAMEGNMMLNLLGPWSWRRGGHYEYRLRESDDRSDKERLFWAAVEASGGTHWVVAQFPDSTWHSMVFAGSSVYLDGVVLPAGHFATWDRVLSHDELQRLYEIGKEDHA